jgi:hypothetical protein
MQYLFVSYQFIEADSVEEAEAKYQVEFSPDKHEIFTYDELGREVQVPIPNEGK